MENAITYPKLQFTESRLRYFYLRLTQELLPAFVLDCYMRISGRKPIFFKLTEKIYKSVRTLDFFTSHSWVFPNDNSLALQNQMSTTDQKIFNFDLKGFDWGIYIRNYCLGAKQYLLREDLALMPQCRKRNLRLKRLQNLLWFSFVGLLIKLIFFRSFSLHRFPLILLRLILTILINILRKIRLIRS